MKASFIYKIVKIELPIVRMHTDEWERKLRHTFVVRTEDWDTNHILKSMKGPIEINEYRDEVLVSISVDQVKRLTVEA